ncbi:DUF6296 family protein [Streptomyces sp. NPDC126499]|uniref:DUF6296 family protein n=1 Tax=Streptomyces sp. NPDC126499 TaxID=3155314 RepID=UPI003328D846
MSAPRYELVFSDPVGAARDVVVVERTSATGPGGHPVYADPTGIIRAEISDRDEVRVLASGGHQEPAQAVVAHRLREAPDDEAPDDEAPDDEAPDDGAPDDGAPDDGAADDGAPGDGGRGDGSRDVA